MTRRRLRPQGVRTTWAPRPKRRAGPPGPLPKLTASGAVKTPEQFKGFTPPAASPPLVAKRLVAWLLAALRFGLLTLNDWLQRRLSEQGVAARLRATLEAMGPTARRAGQRIAMRLDVLPLAYAAELSKIQDSAPPIPLEYAIERTELATGRPLARVFSSFDPKPIASDSIASTYQAVLHTGARVAVRVRRPDAPASFAAERAAMGLLLRLVAPWLPRYRTLLAELERELPRLLLEDMDFVRVARLQRMFRREAKAARLDFLTAAKIYMKLSGPDVIVSEFVAGAWLDEVILAQQHHADFGILGIDPVLCGKHLLHAAWWGFFESAFFCEVPATSRIVVRENGQLVFISLGDTGLLGTRQRKLLYTALERFGLYDLEGGVQMLVQLLMPLPHISVFEFTKRLNSRMWAPLIAMHNPESPAWERASTGLWLALFETTREHGVTVGLDLTRMMQSAISYEHMATRLWPKVDLFREFAKYRREMLRRQRFRKVPRKRRPTLRDLVRMPREVAAKVPEAISSITLWGQTMIESAPVKHISRTAKGAYAMLQAIRAISQVARLALLAAVLRTLWLLHETDVLQIERAVSDVLNHPLLSFAIVLVMLAAARRVLFRLDDVSEDERNKA